MYGTQPQYGAPPPAQQQLVWDRLMYPILPLAQGVMPQVNVTVPIPPALRELYPNVLWSAIDAIQSDANQNPLRRLHFNQIAANNYHNPLFAQLMEQLLTLLDWQLAVSRGLSLNDVMAMISTTARQLVQCKVAAQVRTIPGVAQAVDAQTLAASRQVEETFNAFAAQLEHRYMATMQPAYGQQPQPGYGPQGYQRQGGYPQPQRAPLSPNALQSAMIQQRAPEPPAVAASGNLDWRGKPFSTQQLGGAGIPAAKPSQLRTHEDFAPTQVIVSNAEPVVTVNAPAVRTAAPAAPAPQAARNTLPPVILTPTPVQAPPQPPMAFDPNHFSEEVVVHQGANVRRLKEKGIMDREIHLGRPNHAPAWAKAPTTAEFQQRIEAAKSTEPVGDIMHVVVVNDVLTPIMAANEGFSRCDFAITTLKRAKGKIGAAAFGGLLLKPMAVSDTFFGIVDQIVATKNLVQASALVRSGLDSLSDDDLAAMMQINIRLTHRVNRMVSREMALDSGTITNFSNDAADQIAYLEERFGVDVRKLFESHAGQMLSQALYYVSPKTETYLQVMDFYFDANQDAEKEHASFMLFADAILFATTELDSVKLQLDIPKGPTSALLEKSKAPFAYEVISKITDAAVGGQCDRAVLRLADGVLINIDSGAFNEDALLVSVAQAGN